MRWHLKPLGLILLPYDYFIKNDQFSWNFWGSENWQNGHHFLSWSTSCKKLKNISFVFWIDFKYMNIVPVPDSYKCSDVSRYQSTSVVRFNSSHRRSLHKESNNLQSISGEVFTSGQPHSNDTRQDGEGHAIPDRRLLYDGWWWRWSVSIIVTASSEQWER